MDLKAMVAALLGLLPDETVKQFIDAGLDSIETAVAKSENKIDDAVVLAIVNKLRSACNIPDNDVPAES